MTPLPLWKRIVHLFVTCVILLNLTAPITAYAGDCKRTGTVCTQGPETRNINGLNVYKDCWAWQDSYQCTAIGGEKSCNPLTATTGCGQMTSTCLETSPITGACTKFSKTYTCDKDIKLANAGVLPAGITETAPTHEITSSFDYSVCDANASQHSSCQVTSTTCSQGFANKVVNGVNVSFPCWEEQKSYECLSKTTSTTCDSESNSKCTLEKTTCLNTVNGDCQTGEKVYKCETQAGSTAPSNSCKDKDFGQVVAGLEGAREFAQYFDETSLQFFKGDDSRCAVKLGGALGGNCCKTKTDKNAWRDAAINQAASYALGQLASGYTFTVLTTGASTTIASMVGGSAIGGGIGTFGVGASATSSGSIALTFNPVFFAAAVVMYFVMDWLACEQEDRKTALKNKAGLCVSVGSYCDSKALGLCIEKKQSYCCFVSKLSKIINEQGKAQLALGYGTPKAPECTGFNQAQLEKIDFSKMDFTEFLSEIQYTSPDLPGITNKATDTATGQVNSAAQGTYYGTP